uniref:Uncharacterized protein n=1 Tax=Helianthus annuus TaxID=4232 RepID=A0A251TWE4_HELAN
MKPPAIRSADCESASLFFWFRRIDLHTMKPPAIRSADCESASLFFWFRGTNLIF